MSVDKLVRSGWRGWLTLVFVWTALALLATSALYLNISALNPEYEWKLLFFLQLWIWYLWAVASPGIYAIVSRFPLVGERAEHHVFKHALIHLLAGLFMAGAISAIYVVGRDILYGSQTSLWEGIAQNTFTQGALLRHLVQLLIYGLVVGAMSMIHFNRQRAVREREEAHARSALQRARLDNLQSQLQPHFLFNALNSVSALIKERKNEVAYDMVAHISDLLRASLEQGGRQMIPLVHELEFIKRYVEVERLRFESRFLYTQCVSEELHSFAVPALVIQPLVENTIRHAVEQTNEPVTVLLSARLKEGALCVCVADDGPGLPDDWRLEDDAGVGLSNIRERLDALYGGRAALEVTPNKPSGTVTRLIIPVTHGSTGPEDRSGL